MLVCLRFMSNDPKSKVLNGVLRQEEEWTEEDAGTIRGGWASRDGPESGKRRGVGAAKGSKRLKPTKRALLAGRRGQQGRSRHGGLHPGENIAQQHACPAEIARSRLYGGGRGRLGRHGRDAELAHLPGPVFRRQLPVDLLGHVR